MSQQADTMVLRADEPYYRQNLRRAAAGFVRGVSDRVEGARAGHGLCASRRAGGDVRG